MSLVAEAKVMFSPVVVMSPAVLIPLVAVTDTAPSAKMSASASISAVSDKSNVTVPPLVVLMVLFNCRLVPVMVTPSAVSVSMAPLKTVSRPPACCNRLATVKALAVTLLALTISSAPKRSSPPTGPVKVMSPAPAVSVNPSSPTLVAFKVLANVMLPAFAPVPVLISMLSVSIVAEFRTTFLPTAVMLPAVLIPPVAVIDTSPVDVMLAPEAIAIVPP